MKPLSLEDEHRITSTLLRYATGIDMRNWSLFRSCFAHDLIADYGEFGSWSGPEAITRAMEGIHGPVGRTLHRITNIVACATHDGAGARSYVDAVPLPPEPSGPRHQACGYYDDELVNIEGDWKIRRRTFTQV